MPVDVQPSPKAPHDNQQPAMGATETERVPVVDSVVRAIHNLTTDANYKLVSDVFSEAMFLRDQNRSLKTAKRELLEEYRSFRNDLEEERKKLKEKVEEKERQIAELNGTNKQLAEAKDSMAAQLQEQDQGLVTLTEAKNALEADRAALEAKMAEKDAELAQLSGISSVLKEEKAAAESALQEKIRDVTILGKEKGAMEVSLSTATKELELLAEERARLTAEVSALATAATEMDAELHTLQVERTTLVEGKGVLESRVSQQERELVDLQAVKARLEDARAQLEATTKAGDERAVRIQTLDGELTAMTVTANEAKARVEFLETELAVVTGKAEQLQANLTSTSEHLQAKDTRLAELDGFRVSLRGESEDTYVQILDTIWTSIAGLVETQFRQDLDHNVLGDESCWANLRQSEHLKNAARHIPLPQSNSPAAKQMRVAAVLAVLSRSLHRYVFRPVYLADDHEGDECLAHILRTIACDDPNREEHARATLLAMLPDKQRAAAAKRVAAVVREVSWSVQHLLSALQYEAFCTGLETACKLACVQWMRIQVARMKIEPYFGPPYDSWDWQVLPLPAFGVGGGDEGVVRLHGDGDDHDGAAIVDDTDDVAVEIGRPVDGVPLTPGSGGRVIDQEDQLSTNSSPRPAANDKAGDAEVGPDDIMLVVWPSMCALEHGELESITQGLVLSKEQVRAALDEVRGRGKQRPATKRARTLSMPGRGLSRGPAVRAALVQGDGDLSKDG